MGSREGRREKGEEAGGVFRGVGIKKRR